MSTNHADVNNKCLSDLNGLPRQPTAPTCALAYQPGDFEPKNSFYPKALNATIHPIVKKFFSMKNTLIMKRYAQLNPLVDSHVLQQMLEYKPKHFKWAGKWLSFK